MADDERLKCMIMKGLGAGLRIRSLALTPRFSLRLPSHLWLRQAAGLPSLFEFPLHSRGVKFIAWDCKVTPAGCACQERNTIGCIPSNDGLDAGLRTGFPQRTISCSVFRSQFDITDRVLPEWGSGAHRLGSFPLSASILVEGDVCEGTVVEVRFDLLDPQRLDAKAG
jgi:hypothetical protein